MCKLANYTKTVWLPLILLVAFANLNASQASAQQIQWHQDLAEAKAKARDTNRLVWVHFTADWCVPCKRLNSFVFSNTGVIRAADRNTVAVKIDADAQASLTKQLSVPRIPYDIVMTPSGRTIVNRPSPKNSSDFLKMFNSLDRPLQALNTGDREVINAEIDQLNGVIQRSGGLSQQKSDLDLEGPSHEMASTTVEGQRLERGFESSKRASEIRAIEARLLKQKAELYIATEEKREKIGQGPKVTENPFFKTDKSSTTLPFSGNQSQADTANAPKTVTNSFVQQQDNSFKLQSNNSDSAFALPPAFGKKEAEKVAVKPTDKMTQYEERNEFSFSSTTDKKGIDTTQKKDAQAFTAPNFADKKQTRLELPEFKDRSGKTADSKKFAYSPIDRLRTALQSESEPSVTQDAPTGLKAFNNPMNKSVQTEPTAESPKLSMSASPGPSTSAKRSFNQQRPVAKKQDAAFAKFERPTMQTDFSVPQAPAMMEGVVQIAETTVPTVEGRLVAAEQPIEDNSAISIKQPTDTIQKQLSRTDRLLESVNFFAQDDDPVQSAPRTFAVPGQPVPQSQIVINLNTGNAANPQPSQLANQAVVIQPNFAGQSTLPTQGNPASQVALASSTAAKVNRATISKADIASAVRSKYALKGKCPVTLLRRGSLGRRE